MMATMDSRPISIMITELSPSMPTHALDSVVPSVKKPMKSEAPLSTKYARNATWQSR